MVTPAGYIPGRGDLIWVSLNPRTGHEQAGHRPALILSPKAYNAKTGLCLACPITSKVKGYPFEVTLPEKIAVKGAILADQVKCLDWRIRNARFIQTLPRHTLDETLQRLLVLLS